MWYLVMLILCCVHGAYGNPFLSDGRYCDGKMNIVIGMDSSMSLEDYQYLLITNYTATLLERLNYPEGAAVLAFSDEVELVADFGSITDSNSTALNETVYYPHKKEAATRIDSLIFNLTDKLAGDEILNPFIPRVGVVVTDGRNTGSSESLNAATQHADRNMVDIVTVGVGDRYTKTELLIITNQIEDNIIESAFNDLLDKALDKSVERICLLSQDGDITPKVCSGYFVLAIHIDVFDANFPTTKEFLSDLIQDHIQFNHLYSDIVITVGENGAKQKFSNTTGLKDFLNQMENDVSSQEPLFDPVGAYNRVVVEFNREDNFVKNIIVFITDKPVKDKSSATNFFDLIVRKNDGVEVLAVGITPNYSDPDELLNLTGGMAMHRILTRPTAIRTSGMNKLTGALCHVMNKSPIKVVVEFSSTAFTFEESPSLSKNHTVTLTRESVDLSSTSSVFLESYSIQGIQDSATISEDFTTVNQTITFQPGEASKNVSILIKHDVYIEPLEYFILSLSSPNNCTIGHRNITSVFIVDKTEPYKGPSEIAVAFKYCPPPFGTDTEDTYLKHMDFLKKLIKHSKIGLHDVQLTAQVFCKEVFTLTSIKSYMPTFHVSKGLHVEGAASDLHATISEATEEMAKVLDGISSGNKFIFVIFHDNYELDPRIGSVFIEAASKGIHLIPLVLSKDTSSVTSVSLPQGYQPYNIYLNELGNLDYTSLESHLKQMYSIDLKSAQLGWTNIGITTNSMGLNQDTLLMLQKYVFGLTGLYNQQDTAASYDKMMQNDLTQHTNNPIKYSRVKLIARNMNLPVQRMIARSPQPTTPSVKKILILFVTGESTVPGVLDIASKARQSDIKIHIIGINIDDGSKEKLQNISDDNLIRYTGFSSLPIFVIAGLGFKIAEEVGQNPGNIMVALDSSEAVSSQDMKFMIGAVRNLVSLWSFRLQNTRLTIGMFSDIYVDIADGLLTKEFRTALSNKDVPHMNEMSSFSRMIVDATHTLNMNQESTDVTRVAVVVSARQESNGKQFAVWASETAKRDGIKLISVGPNSQSFNNTVALIQAIMKNEDSANIIATAVMNNLPIKGKYDVLLAVSADQTLNDKEYQWIKNFTLIFTSLLINDSNLNKFGVMSYSGHNKTQISPLDTSYSTNYAAVIQSIKQLSRQTSEIRTDVYLKSILNIFDTEYSNSPKAAIILQNENSTSRRSTQSAAWEAYKHGVNLLVLGVGQDIANSEMNAISYFTKEHTTRISSENLLETDGLKWTLNTLKTIEPIHLNRPAEDCYGAAELAFAMDASMSLDKDYFEAIKETVATTIRYLNISDEMFRVRVVLTFNGSVEIVAQDETSKEALIQKVEEAFLTGGPNKIFLAINKTTEHLLKAPQRKVKKIAVLITDGKSLDRQLTIKEAKYAAENNIINIAMAIGDELSVSLSGLMDVVANKTENIIWMKTFEELRLYGAKQLLTHICNMSRIEHEKPAKTTPPSTTTIKQTTPAKGITIPPIRIVTDEACLGASIGSDGFGYVSHPYECDRYVVCDAKWTVHDIRNCPLYMFWDDQGKDCNIIDQTTCVVDTCIGKPDDFNYTTPRIKNDATTCNRYYTCINEKTSHVCECMGRLDKVMIEGVLAEVRRVAEKFDSATATCIDDLTNQCSTFLDPNNLPQPKTITCNKIQLSPKKYEDLDSLHIHTCPGNQFYEPKICDCEEKVIGGSSSHQNGCVLFVDYTFDDNDNEEELKNIQVNDLHRGGIFTGNTGVTINSLAGNYSNQFAVQMEIERTGNGNMIVFKNCIQTDSTTLSLYFVERQTDVLVMAELSALSEKFTLAATSQNLKNKIKVFITLAATNQKIALWVKKTNGVLEGKHEMDFPSSGSTLDLACNGPLQLGGMFGPGSKGFVGFFDEFRWYKGDLSGCNNFIDDTIIDVMNL